MQRCMKLAFLACLGMFVATSRVDALGVAPLVLEIGSGPQDRTAQIIVENDSANDVPIEIQISRVEIDENGGQHLDAAPSQFLVMPPARMLKPHTKQVFRIQWTGAPLTSSQSFIFSVNQLPVKMPESESGVQFIFSFDVFANVAPPSGTHTLDIVSSAIVTENGKRYPSLLLTNKGNIHSKLGDATLALKAGAWSRTITSGEMQMLLGGGLVQPGKRRRFVIPVELPSQAANLVAEVTYDKGRK